MFHEKMKTGEFAKLCRVDKKTLFYYDEINLLKPAFRSENGYRCYTSAQYDRMNIIKILQTTGLSLEEISSIIKTTSYEKRFECLSVQSEHLNQKIQELTNARQHLERGLALMQCFLEKGENRIFEEMQEEAYYKIYPIQPPHSLGFLSDGYEYGVFYDPSSSQFKEQSRPNYYFHTAAPEDSDFRKPGGSYICMFHLLKMNETDHISTIQYFLESAKQAGLQTQGMIFHESSFGEFFGNEEYNTLIKISCKKDM